MREALVYPAGVSSLSGACEKMRGMDAEHPESYCHRCDGPNRVWYAPSPLWNAVMRGGSISGTDEFDGIVCPTCFMVLAEERGVASMWRLDAQVVHAELELTTPSGRTWDADADLWRECDNDARARNRVGRRACPAGAPRAT